MGKSRRARKKLLQQTLNGSMSSYAAALLDTKDDTKKQGKGSNSKNKTKAIGLTKKQKRHEKQRDFLKSLKILKEQKDKERDKSKLNSMGDLESSLKSVSSTQGGIKPAKRMTNRQRKRLVAEEVKNFCAVMEHPAFQSNPLDTINEHLTNSIAVQKELEEGIKLEDSGMDM
uniref:Ribosome biogenesis protein SLX9 n=1 Tax=Lotharella globosa TaxID=91324 RepID=A0A7S3Z3A9_9EUKA|mmetsp:Transcript_270/g.451  ORF Transcript_270/g.451 Transcript_270/m.451 type:complete len:172 (+) Transcript_270:58-573(+)